MSDLERLRQARVLTVGDVMLDEYLWGEVQRISPEAPVPVVDVRDHTFRPGGAANVATGVVALGAGARLVGVVGEDAAATRLRESLQGAGVAGDDLVVDPERPTTSKMRVIAHAQQVVRADRETRAALSEGVEQGLLERARSHLADVDAVVLSDYGKGVVTEPVARTLVAACREAGKPLLVDPKGFDFARFAGATVITPNAPEAARAAAMHLEQDPDLVEVSRRLSALLEGSALLITRGAAGMSLFDGERRTDVAAEAREVYDVTGAGDTVVAVLAAALGAGYELNAAMRLANLAAGIVVGKVGTSTVSLEELRARARA